MLFFVRLGSQDSPPDVSHLRPYKAVLVLESKVAPDRQAAISKWLVRTGCLYMLAWGVECSSWDDSVDLANLEAYDFGDIPEESDIMTTWHEGEPLQEVFWFAKNSAEHPVIPIENTLVIHFSDLNRADELKRQFDNA
jgi:hypothetical protein